MSVLELDSQTLSLKLESLSETLSKYGDKVNAQILNDLHVKLETEEITAACCGYVSAGKSRLVNTLIGAENLLPVSPLPTSKNSVLIRQGKQNTLKLQPKDTPSSTLAFPGVRRFHELCQDSTLASLELSWANSEYISDISGFTAIERISGVSGVSALSIIDTPGIDSLESASQMAKNPALLMADLVLYVMDYNHVQSQVNFSFLKALEAEKIPYVLVVNQIDKHVELELSLAEFRARLIQALKHWDLSPSELYFTSLNEQHPESQLEALRKTLSELSAMKPGLVLSTVIRSARQVIKRHGEFFSALQDDLREPHLWVKEQALSEQEAALALAELESKIESLTSLARNIESEIIPELDKLLDNAPLFSFETRELSKQFLESRQPGFKVGFLGSAAKTKTEQEKRLNKLYQELTNRTEAHLTWHLRTILGNIPSRFSLQGENYTAEASQLTVHFEPELLTETIRPGALISGEYVLNYTRDLAEAIKAVYRRNSLLWVERAQNLAEQKNRDELESLQQQAGHYKRVLKSFVTLRELDALNLSHVSGLLSEWEQAAALHPQVSFGLQHGLSEPAVSEPAVPSLTLSHSGSNEIFPAEDEFLNKNTFPSKNPFSGKSTFTETSTASAAHHLSERKLWKSAQTLKACAELVRPLPGFRQRAEHLEHRAARLENNLFTVALFGAFSAGKSSLANALLGDNVLPVSPNPTTAAINKILPPTEEYPHGTIKVKLKSLSELTADVLFSLSIMGLNTENLDQALEQIPVLETLDLSSEAKPHLSFLKAVLQGQSALLQHLGEELSVNFSDFRDFVVQEDKACFVDSIELYFSCPLTELGVILVDTPGSNSTNARHTNVSFDYIKNADAVLFVTYYNNSFCKADAQFLAQLGKVKDAFEMDKMFFLVNAADLAQTPEELKLVLKHVEQNLRASDIMRPRIFPVSSQLALLAKLAAAGGLKAEAEALYRKLLKAEPDSALPEAEESLVRSGLKPFETSFYSFIENDLTRLALETAAKDIARIAEHVAGLVEAAKTDNSLRAEKLEHFRLLEQAILSGLSLIAHQAEEHALNQEIDELFYYVNQRIYHRSSAIFDQSFFILAKPKEEQPKQAVQQCLREFLQDIEVDLIQELRATSLRLERFVSKILNQVLLTYLNFVKRHDEQCSLRNTYEFSFPEVPQISACNWDHDAFTKIPALYKNPKDWVEGQGRTKMREALSKIAQIQVQAWLNEHSNAFKELWQRVFEQESSKLKEQTRSEISGYYSGLVSALGNGYGIKDLEHIQREMDKLK